MEYEASVINRILNFRRHITVTASDFYMALELAKKALPGYNDVEWCMPSNC